MSKEPVEWYIMDMPYEAMPQHKVLYGRSDCGCVVTAQGDKRVTRQRQ